MVKCDEVVKVSKGYQLHSPYLFKECKLMAYYLPPEIFHAYISLRLKAKINEVKLLNQMCCG
jgi:hypothetical protein